MAIFDGLVSRAYYINEKFDTIRVEYDDGGEALRGYVLPVDENNSDYQDLLKQGWDKEKLAEDTAEVRRSSSRQFAEIVNAQVAIQVEEVLKKYNIHNYQKYLLKESGDDTEFVSHADHTRIWDTLLSINENKEDLFAFKMWALDSELTKKATVDQKKALRRASTVLEGLSVLYLMQ